MDPLKLKILKHCRADENAFDSRLRDADFGEVENLESREKKLGGMNMGDMGVKKPEDLQHGREAGERTRRQRALVQRSTIERELLEEI